MFLSSAASRALFLALLGLSFVAFVRDARADDLDRPPPVESVMVKLKARRNAYLEQQRSDGTWQQVCAAPCGIALPVDGAYRVVGADGHASAPVVLTAGAENEIEVDRGAPDSARPDPARPLAHYSSQHNAGVALTAVGGLFLAPAGVVTVGVLAAGICPSQYCPSPGDVAEAYEKPFVFIPLVVGLAAFGSGATLLLTDSPAPAPTAVPSPRERDDLPRRTSFAPAPRTATLLRLTF
jgi:hypothetical protein